MSLPNGNQRILIWGKTAPELSSKHYETVCTGGVFEDGTPVRLYPIPFRYMDEQDRFKKYQWITARIVKASDPRPESYRIDCESIEVGDLVPPDTYEWHRRSQVLFQGSRWEFDSMDDLMESQTRTKQSLATMSPKEIISVELHQRPEEEQASFEQKKEMLSRQLKLDREQLRLFEECMPDEMKGIDFVKTRIAVKWKCGDGKLHVMQVMDWEVIELQRKAGDEKARQAVCSRLDLTQYATRFFLGNTAQHPNRFSIVGLWYPKRQTGVLF